MTEIYPHIVARMADYMDTHPYTPDNARIFGCATFQIAIYGYDFNKAAKECWALVKDVGLMPLLNNILVSAVGWMGARTTSP